MSPLVAAILVGVVFLIAIALGIVAGIVSCLMGFNAGHRAAKGMTPAPQVDWSAVREAIKVKDKNKQPEKTKEPVPPNMQLGRI